jgi:hypothetical protein
VDEPSDSDLQVGAQRIENNHCSVSVTSCNMRIANIPAWLFQERSHKVLGKRQWIQRTVMMCDNLERERPSPVKQ